VGGFAPRIGFGLELFIEVFPGFLSTGGPTMGGVNEEEGSKQHREEK